MSPTLRITRPIQAMASVTFERLAKLEKHYYLGWTVADKRYRLTTSVMSDVVDN